MRGKLYAVSLATAATIAVAGCTGDPQPTITSSTTPPTTSSSSTSVASTTSGTSTTPGTSTSTTATADPNVPEAAKVEP